MLRLRSILSRRAAAGGRGQIPHRRPGAGARLRLWRRGERGTSAVELAFVLPVLLLLILGAVDFGQLVLYHNAVSEAARDGARVGMVRVTPNPTVTSPPVITTPIAEAIEAAAREKVLLGGRATVVAAVVPPAGQTVADSYHGYAVRVVVTSEYQPIGLLGGVTNVQVRGASQINR